MKSLAESTQVLAGQLTRLKEIPISDELCHIMREFSVIMKEVVKFIHKWLHSWICTYAIVWMGA